MQLTLKNIETETCPKCKLALVMCSLDGNTLWYWCPSCVDIFEFTVCKCGKIYSKDEFKYCPECRESGYMVIKNGASETH